MKVASTYKILLYPLAVLFLSHEITAKEGGDVSVIHNTEMLAKTYPNIKGLEREVSYILGRRKKDDYLVYSFIKEDDHLSETDGHIPANAKISYVVVNFVDNVDGDEPHIRNGGIGQSSITIVVDKAICKSIYIYATSAEPGDLMTTTMKTDMFNGQKFIEF